MSRISHQPALETPDPVHQNELMTASTKTRALLQGLKQKEKTHEEVFHEKGCEKMN